MSPIIYLLFTPFLNACITLTGTKTIEGLYKRQTLVLYFVTQLVILPYSQDTHANRTLQVTKQECYFDLNRHPGFY